MSKKDKDAPKSNIIQIGSVVPRKGVADRSPKLDQKTKNEVMEQMMSDAFNMGVNKGIETENKNVIEFLKVLIVSAKEESMSPENKHTAEFYTSLVDFTNKLIEAIKLESRTK